MARQPEVTVKRRMSPPHAAVEGPAGEAANRSMEELVHTLQVQRVELEIQNDELRRTQLALEESRDRYLDLYEFAPVAYLTLASSGQIAETNLTTAALLGVERQQLLGQHFTGLVASDDRERWQRLFRGLTRTDAAQNAELALMRGNGTVFHALVNCRRVATEQRDPVVRLTLTDISEHQQIEDARHFLLECGNRHASEDFFKSLAQYLAQSLQMDYVCIDRLEGDSLHAHTLAVYADGAFEDNVSYALQDTPCGDVVGNLVCCFPEKVRERFPCDEVLQTMGAESYVGTTLWSFDGKPIGLIAIIGRKPLANRRLAESLLQLVAPRAAGELVRRRAEMALRESEERLFELFDEAPLPYQSLDIAGNILMVNQAWLSLIGRNREEVIGHFIGEFISDASLATLSLEFPQFKDRGRVDAPEFDFVRPDGSRRRVLINGRIARDQAGNFLRTHCILTDITERKHAEQQLRVAAAAFEAQEGMMVTDADSVILRVNVAFTEITGYSAAEAVGQTPRLLRSDRHDAAFYEAMWDSIRSKGAWHGEIWNRHKCGEVHPEWMTITAVKGADGEVSHYVSTLTDITQSKAAADEIAHLAFYDTLTGLPNRRLLLDRLQRATATSQHSRRQGALLFIDLDNFKTLNDTLGHDMGDLLLQQVAQRLAACVREGDSMARLGGDEFVVVLENLDRSARTAALAAKKVGEKILDYLNQPYQLAGCEHHSTPSIGITLFRGHREGVDELLKQADLAMYQAKASGRNTLRFFDPEMQAGVAARAALEADLRQGIRQQQFLLHYQPQVDGQGRLTGAEALLRWQHPARGLVPPAEFIGLAEDTGLIVPLGQWVLATACAQLVAWAARPSMAHLKLVVNVSARQFQHPDFVPQVLAMLEESGADPRRLKLELTESLLLNDGEEIIAKMAALKACGVSLSLDDFGTGYAALSYLKRLPLDELKIDQCFVRDLLTDVSDAAIARTIIALAQSLGLRVIAEGVETEVQRDLLAGYGCRAFQGYFFGRPGPAAGLFAENGDPEILG
ncbi:MAG: EAL domain-containing protein [Candidatus Accumulibacter phosphatis]|uniref:sensor domain-containing protein n=1 Tax=Candidatus Accumulibacter contiguus TaxID=2954381 RepID=UPI00145D7D2A|nr:EAL domain-containing protein [Candidatus Accumulibacter contiguus]